MTLRPNAALDAAFGAEPEPIVRPTRPLRRNDLLDDAFGIPPAKWQGEAKPKPPMVSPVPSKPKPVAPEKSPAVPLDVLPVLAVVVQPAATLERPGEDLLYLNGQWLHRYHHCGWYEEVLVIHSGRNPVRQLRALFTAARSQAVIHTLECPYNGRF